MIIDKKKLLDDVVERYRRNHATSAERFETACGIQVRGGSHNLRLFQPFPFYDAHCSGSKVTDIDGNTYIDYWQGHFANILGHNPAIVIDALRGQFQDGQGLATGFPGIIQAELAGLILGRLEANSIRFTTSGTLATMYAVMLARAFTKRESVMKVAGGWHGSQPFALKGIFMYLDGLGHIESAGLPAELEKQTIVTRFNDIDDLEKIFKNDGEKVACFIVEPFIGSGGFIFAEREYLQRARELTERYGTVLIFDEVISGFRFHAGAVQTLFGVRPDLSAFGKVIGGGMPVSAVAGKREILALCDTETDFDTRVKFEGGTYSAHPASMLAGNIFLKHLIDHEKEIYPTIGRHGNRLRAEVEEIFEKHGFHVRCSGGGKVATDGSSIVGVNFVDESIDHITCPDQVLNPETSDLELRDGIFRLAMLNEGINVMHGLGAVSAAHSEEDIQTTLDAVESIAEQWKTYKRY